MPLTVSITERDVDMVRAATSYSTSGDEVKVHFDELPEAL